METSLSLQGSAEGGQVFPLVEQEQSTLSSRQTGNTTGETGVSLGHSPAVPVAVVSSVFTSTQNQTKQQLANLPETCWPGVQNQPALSGQTFYLDFISVAAETLSLKGSSPTPVPWCPREGHLAICHLASLVSVLWNLYRLLMFVEHNYSESQG